MKNGNYQPSNFCDFCHKEFFGRSGGSHYYASANAGETKRFTFCDSCVDDLEADHPEHDFATDVPTFEAFKALEVWVAANKEPEPKDALDEASLRLCIVCLETGYAAHDAGVSLEKARADLIETLAKKGSGQSMNPQDKATPRPTAAELDKNNSGIMAGCDIVQRAGQQDLADGLRASLLRSEQVSHAVLNPSLAAR